MPACPSKVCNSFSTLDLKESAISVASNFPSRWNLIIDATEQSLEERGRELASLVARREEAMHKLQTLIDYRSGYEQQREAAQRNGIAADALRNQQSFLATLERATEEQSDRVTSAQKLVFECEAVVQELRRKIHSFAILKDREAVSEAERDRRRQQRLQDEAASRMRLAN